MKYVVIALLIIGGLITMYSCFVVSSQESRKEETEE